MKHIFVEYASAERNYLVCVNVRVDILTAEAVLIVPQEMIKAEYIKKANLTDRYL